MNLSEKTRKQLVYEFLLARVDTWVDGPDLADPRVGGSEGLRRVRELRDDGHLIDVRRHPNPRRDFWQYRLRLSRSQERRLEVMGALQDFLARPVGVEPTATGFGDRRGAEPRPQPQPSTRRLKDAVQKSDDGWLYIPPEPDPNTSSLGLEVAPGIVEGRMGPMFKTMPSAPDFGSIVVCPRCKGHRKKETRLRDGRISPPDPICYEPNRRGTPCIRCGGFGVVPNKGAIPSQEIPHE